MRTIRQLVQECFYNATEQLDKENSEQAQWLYVATVQWLLHAGISGDVKVRPYERVHNGAGHSCGAILYRYTDVELAARAKFAKNNKLSSNLVDFFVEFCLKIRNYNLSRRNQR